MNLSSFKLSFIFVRIYLGKYSIETAGYVMIVYDPFFETLKKRGFTQYLLIKEYKISHGLLDRMRKNLDISLYSVNLLCGILDCDIEDICRYVPEDSE